MRRKVNSSRHVKQLQKRPSITLTRLFLEVRSSDFHGLFSPFGSIAAKRRLSGLAPEAQLLPLSSMSITLVSTNVPPSLENFPQGASKQPSDVVGIEKWDGWNRGPGGLHCLFPGFRNGRFERNWNTRILLIFPRNVRSTSLFFTPKLVLESDLSRKKARFSRTHNGRRSLHLCQTQPQKDHSSDRLINSTWLHP
jgi:hypothetical protein